MHVATASLELKMEGLSARIWMDTGVNALRVELETTQPTTMKVELQRWRNETRPWTDAEQGYTFFCSWSNRSVMPPDVIVPPTNGAKEVGELLWYHRNAQSSWKSDMTHQGLGHALDLSADPFINRTFGALVTASSGTGRRLSSHGAQQLVSQAAAIKHTISAFMLAEQTPTAETWVSSIRTLSKATELRSTAQWSAAWAAQKWSWTKFWNTSRLGIRSSGPAPLPAGVSAGRAGCLVEPSAQR